jgi:hypothetical protein
MSDLLWRKLKEVMVPELPGASWSVALDYVEPKRFYRVKVQAGGQWRLKGQPADCSADGYPRDVIRASGGSPLVADAPLGCLIAKVGGSTADNTGLLFAAGRFSVFQVDEGKAGPLYLGVNDLPIYMSDVQSAAQVKVDIEVAL